MAAAAVNKVTVDELYSTCEKIDASATPDSSDFRKILEGTKSGPNEKRLSSQLVVRYFSKFPNEQDAAIDAVFELCEDDDINIRKFVIKELPNLCKEKGSHVIKIADVLIQLLQSDDAQENHIVQTALMTVLSRHVKETLKTMFDHIVGADEDLLRDRACKFLTFKVKTLPPDILTKEIQDYIIEETQKLLQDVSGDEFILFVSMLSSLGQLQSVRGRQQIVDMIIEQADLDKAFDAKDADRVDQVIQCTKQAISFFSKNVRSTPFLDFILESVLPTLSEIATSVGSSQKLELIRLISDLSPHAAELKDPSKSLDVLVQMILAILPKPPSEDESENARDPEEPQLAFSEVEGLLWAFHQLSKRHPTYFTSNKEREAEMREVRKRLQYLARVIQVYSKKLRDILKDKTKEELKSEENRVKVLALRTTANISAIVKDLLHFPPSLKCVIFPSWKPLEKAEAKAAAKRAAAAPIAAGELAAKRAANRPAKGIYQPPTGKWSERAGAFPGWRGSLGGGFRGRGRGRRF